MKGYNNVTLWSYPDEFLLTYKYLFSSQLSDRKKAIQQIKLWSERGQLPLSIESTYQLMMVANIDHQFDLSIVPSTVDALENDQLNIQFEFAPVSNLPMESSPLDHSNHLEDDHFVLMYAMCIVRFVNGLVDSKQNKIYAQSITKLAEDIGLPRWFVDLRHEITHNKLPSLEILRMATKEAITWLHENYWQAQVDTVINMDRYLAIGLQKYMTVYMDCFPPLARTFLNIDTPPKLLEKAVIEFFGDFEALGTCLHLQRKTIYQMISLTCQCLDKKIPVEYLGYLWLPLLSPMMEHTTLFLDMIVSIFLDYIRTKFPEYLSTSAALPANKLATNHFQSLEEKYPIIPILLHVADSLLTRCIVHHIKDRYYLTIPLQALLKHLLLTPTPWSLKMIEKIEDSGLIKFNQSLQSLRQVLKARLVWDDKTDLQFDQVDLDKMEETLGVKGFQLENVSVHEAQNGNIVANTSLCPVGLSPGESGEELLRTRLTAMMTAV